VSLKNKGQKVFRLPSEIPDEEWPQPGEFVDESKRIVDFAQEKGVTLRVMGGLAIYLRCKEYEELWKGLKRLGKKVFTDIDLAGYGKHRTKILKIMEELGYDIWKLSLQRFAGRRYIFYGGRIPMVEVFFDRLQMNHVIEFKGRLEKDKYTLPLAELLMMKLQIVQINEKDIKDSIILLRAYDIGEDDTVINGKYIAKVLAKDWGFYYTFTNNLEKVKSKLQDYQSILSESDIDIVKNRIEKLRDIIEREPKSLGWKMRAKLGTKVKWYEEVEDWL